MKCPYCDSITGEVIDSRKIDKPRSKMHTNGQATTRRRRQCSNGHRFTTYEYIASE